MKISPLPMKSRLFYFPVGRFKNVVVTGYEAKHIVDYAKIEKIKGWIYTGKSSENIKGFIEEFFDNKAKYKLAGDVINYHFTKLALNGSYGKTLQKNPLDYLERNLAVSTYDVETGEYKVIDIERKFEAAGMFNPVIASWITGMARARLFGFMKRDEDKTLYTDSVTGDTPILVKKNNKFVDFMEIQELSPASSLRYCGRSLENLEVFSRNGWSKILYVYKHKTDKPIHVIAGDIYCKVTGDHSIFQNGSEKKVSELHIGDKIDKASLPETLKLKGITEDYARLLGYFAAEGTCGRYDTKWGIKYSWALNDANNKKLEKYKLIAESSFGISFKILDCMASSSCNKLVPVGNIKYLSELFYPLCYSKHGNKKVPTIIFNSDIPIMKAYLDGYMEGDGCYVNKNYDRSGQRRNDSISFILQAGISFLSAKLGFKSRFLIRDDKPNIIGHSQSMKTKEGISRIRKDASYDYVYDISTSDGTFIGGCGLVIFHNTDSLIVRGNHHIPTGNKLGDLDFDTKGIATIIREKLYMIKDNEKIVKTGKHGFWDKPDKMDGGLLSNDSCKRKKVSYSINRMTTLRESYRQKSLPFVFHKQARELGLMPSTKREVPKHWKLFDYRNSMINLKPIVN